MSEDSHKDQIVRSTTDGLSKRSSGLVRRGLQDLAVSVPNDRKRILVADDQEAINEVMGAILKAAGYEVRQTTHPSEVVAIVDEFKPQVALISLVAPEIDGVELSLRLSKRFPQLKIVLTCEIVEEGILQHLLDNGVACDAFEAPFEREDLLEMMKTWAKGFDYIDPATHLRKEKAFQVAVRNANFFQGTSDRSTSVIFVELFESATSDPILEPEATFLRELGGTLGRFAHDASAYKWGQNQFAMLLPNIDKPRACDLSKQLNVEVKSLLKTHNLDARYSVAIGVASLPGDAKSVEQVVEAGRQLITKAKETGQGGITVWGEWGVSFVEPAVKDALTGLYYFRHIDVVLDTEIDRSQRYAYEFSLVFVDVDQIKDLASSLSNVAFNKLLAEVGQFIQSIERKIDWGFRYRNEGFALVLPQASKENTCIVAQRIHRLFRETVWLALDDESLRLTASIGVATYPTDAKTKTELIHRADEALHLVKNSTGDGVAAANVGVLPVL